MRPRGLASLILAAVAAFALAIGVTAASSSTPPDSTLNVPSSAGTARDVPDWGGTIPPGVNPTSDCNGFEALSDEHIVHINVPAGLYTNFNAEFRFQISWTPTSPSTSTSDEILTVNGPLNPGGDPNEPGESEEVGSSDGGGTTETVVAQNLPSGDYQMLACGFANAAPQPYVGKVEVRVSARAAEPSLPAANPQGLSFTAAVPSEQQRPESEPLIEIDKDGNTYTCGPAGVGSADFAQVSLDGGDQFHMIGTPPVGLQAIGGGGDCALATGLARNSRGNYQYSYAGLGPLTGFVTATSPDLGQTESSTPANGNGLPGGTTQGVLADRQWTVFIPDTSPGCATVPTPGAEGCVLLIYNQQVPRNVVVQKSTNGGLTYSPAASIGAQNPRFPGPIRYEPRNGIAYFPWDREGEDGDHIHLSISRDGGQSWTECLAAIAPADTAGFTVADHDSQGNIYIVYGEQAKFHTYMVSISALRLPGCNEPVLQSSKLTTVRPGFTRPVQVDREAIRTTVFPWITAGGQPGRVQVSFYGTTTDGDPNIGCDPTKPEGQQGFCAAWDVYVNQSLNALGGLTQPTFSQVKATTHPMHYDSICLRGLACNLSSPSGDRSLADFFAIDFNAVSNRSAVVFNRAEKIPNESEGHVATPLVVVQNGGPSNAGGTVAEIRPVVRNTSLDPAGDAISNYSISTEVPTPLPTTLPVRTNEDAMDFVGTTAASPAVQVGPPVDPVTGNPDPTGGFTVRLRIRDLSAGALTKALADSGSGALLWVFRFVNGYQAAAATAYWTPTAGFSFGFNDYSTAALPCRYIAGVSGNAGDFCVVYPGQNGKRGRTIPGAVSGNTITLTVPRDALRALDGPIAAGDPRPKELGATATPPSALPNDARFYDATAFSLGNSLAILSTQNPRNQSFFYPFDNAPAMDFLLGGATLTPPPPPPPADPAVTLTKTGPASATRGSTITYTLEYRNLGPRDASSARIVDTLPSGVSYVSSSPSGSYSSFTRKVTWNLGTVPVGASGTLTLRVRVNSSAPSSITNKADFVAPETVSPPTATWTTAIE